MTPVGLWHILTWSLHWSPVSDSLLPPPTISVHWPLPLLKCALCNSSSPGKSTWNANNLPILRSMSLTRTRLFSPTPFSPKKTDKFFPKLAPLLKFSSSSSSCYSQNSWEREMWAWLEILSIEITSVSLNLLISEETNK